jgi:hypothetical protein
VAARVIRSLLALVAITGVAEAERAAVGASPPASNSAFGWRAPAGCPKPDDVRLRIERRLGAPIDGAVHGVEIEITREPGGFVAQIDARALTVANDVRTLHSARCEDLADAISVILARLASEVRVAARASPPAPSWRGAGLPRPAGQDLAEAPDRAARVDEMRGPETGRRFVDMPVGPRQTRRWGGGVRALALSGIGALPRINIGGELGGYVRRDAHFLELAVGRWVPQAARLDPGAPARVEVSLDVVTVRAGWGPEELPIRAWLEGEVGTIQGEGVAVLDPQVASARWIALGGGFGVAWPMSPRARLVGTFELAIPLQRTRFMLQNGADLYQPAAAAARCALGLEVGWR